MVFEYKYNYELSTKRQIFLWLYQVLPNIDVIKHIYQFKEDLELDEIRMYHGLCPKNVITTGVWIPLHITGMRGVKDIYNRLEKSIEYMKYIAEEGFICEFYMSNNHSNEVMNQIYNGHWITLVPDVNEKPSYRKRIKVINHIYNYTPISLFYFYKRIERIYQLYKCTHGINIYRLGIDQNDEIYIPNIHV
jgi:hypothetical protein